MDWPQLPADHVATTCYGYTGIFAQHRTYIAYTVHSGCPIYDNIYRYIASPQSTLNIQLLFAKPVLRERVQ